MAFDKHLRWFRASNFLVIRILHRANLDPSWKPQSRHEVPPSAAGAMVAAGNRSHLTLASTGSHSSECPGPGEETRGSAWWPPKEEQRRKQTGLGSLPCALL